MNATVNPREVVGGNKPPLVTEKSLADDFKHVAVALDGFAAEADELPLVVEDDEDVSAIVAFVVKKVNPAIKRIEELRTDTKEPYLAAGRTVDSFFKGLGKRAGDLKTALEQRVTSYNVKKANAERAARQAEEQRLREEAQRKQQEAIAAAQAASAGQESPDVAEKMTQAAEAAKAADTAAVAAQAKPADMARTKTEAGTASLREDWTHKVENYTQIDLEKLRAHFSPADIDKAIRSFVRAGGRELAGVKIYAVQKTTIR